MPNFVKSAQTTAVICQFSIFQDSGGHLGFFKFQIFNGRGSRNGSPHGWDMAIFRFFKTAASAILNFRNFKILTVKRNELHQRAKFRQNLLNRGRDMAIFRFFKMAAAILDFWDFKFLTATGRSGGSSCIIVLNFVEIAQTAAAIWLFFNFSRWLPPSSWISKF